ncbi:hypothetical protein [Dactylosporangium sp. CS-033363]|uniref:hypothetical protein n=1 Tax=Dactylosporangium sp. CS-033363 TaxID=3239935 RepID=UPI003D906DE6
MTTSSEPIAGEGPSRTPPKSGATTVEQKGFTEPKAFSPAEVAAKTQAPPAIETARPTLLPPTVAGAQTVAADAVTATWRSNQTVTATWSISEPRNAWMHVKDLGWRKLYNGRDWAFTALVTLAAQARQTQRPITFREEADGMVYEIYLW